MNEEAMSGVGPERHRGEKKLATCFSHYCHHQGNSVQKFLKKFGYIE